MNALLPEIEIFRAGRQTDASGTEVNLSHNDLDAIATGYNPTLHEAPLVIGHPYSDAPAWGWVISMRRKTNTLLAKIRNIAPDIANAVQKGQYKKVSASFYKPNAKTNPKPNQWYLRHIGLLGAQAPAVKGLAPLRFSEADKENDAENVAVFTKQKTRLVDLIPFAQTRNDPPETETVALSEESRQTTALKDWTELQNFVDTQIENGRILPYQREQIITFLGSLDPEPAIRFCEGQALTDQRQWFKAFLTTLPTQIQFQECAAETQNPKILDGVEIGKKAAEYMRKSAEKGNIVSSREAVQAVTKSLS